MTREQAIAEAQSRQRSNPHAKCIATQRGGEWVVASIGLAPHAVEPTATAVKPPPATPHDEPQSPLQRVTTLYGSGG
jgi:hypothetical protein